MIAVLGILLLASVFEIRRLVKMKEKKELIVYLAVLACAVSLGTFLMLSSDYKSFAKSLLDLLKIKV
jgi:Na+/melibiose symporter-like transporter